jgi:ABC-2 type transport system permease protein
MVGILIRIKLALLRHSLTGSRAALLLVGGALGLLLAAGTLLLSLAQSSSSASAVNALCLVFLLWTLGWVLGPLLTGGDNSLRPEFFRLLPVSSRRLVLGLLGSSFVGIPPGVSVVAFSGLLFYAAHLGPVPLLVAVVAVPLQLACVILLSRVLGRAVDQATRSRLGLELGALLIGFVIAFVNVGWWALPVMGRTLGQPAPVAAAALRLVPSGWAIVAIAAAGQAEWALALAPLLGLMALCALLVSAWAHLLTRGSTTTRRGAVRGRARHPRVLPASPLGAVLGKELRTWGRDPVRGRFLRMGLWMAVFFGVLPAIAGARGVLPWIGPLAVLCTTAFAGNMYGFDGSALWLTLTTPGAERADVRGRQLAWLLLVTALALPLTVALTVISGQQWGWPVAAALLPALLGSGAGVIVLLSVLRLVSVTDPGRRGPGLIVAGEDMDAGQLQVQGFLALALMLALASPAAVVTLLGVTTQRLALQGLGMALGLCTGLLVGWWFGRLAYRRLSEHGAELLAMMTRR